MSSSEVSARRRRIFGISPLCSTVRKVADAAFCQYRASFLLIVIHLLYVEDDGKDDGETRVTGTKRKCHAVGFASR